MLSGGAQEVLRRCQIPDMGCEFTSQGVNSLDMRYLGSGGLHDSCIGASPRRPYAEKGSIPLIHLTLSSSRHAQMVLPLSWLPRLL